MMAQRMWGGGRGWQVVSSIATSITGFQQYNENN